MLGAVQDRLWRLITEPEGVEAALRATGDAGGAELAALVCGDGRATPVERVSVYAHAYFTRIHDSLREDFGALARALGPAGFHDLVKTYLMLHPPSQPSLRHAGEHLAEHLSLRPFAEIFARRCPYAADLARLEWAISEAFFAADAPVLGRDELAAVAVEDWGSLRFEPSPSLELLTCAWPVERVRERFDREHAEAEWDAAPPLAAERTCLRVWRLDDSVRYQAVSSLELEALAAVREGARFSALCERLAAACGEAGAAPQAAAFLSAWVADGLLARLR